MSLQSQAAHLGLFEQLQRTITQLVSVHSHRCEQEKDDTVLEQISIGKWKQKHFNEIKQLKEQIESKNSLIAHLQTELVSKQDMITASYRQEFGRLVGFLNDRDAENQYLQRQLARQKQKILQLETEILNLQERNSTLQKSYKRFLDSLKQKMNSIPLKQPDFLHMQFMSSSYFVQLVNKVERIFEMGKENDLNKNYINDKYHKLKNKHQKMVEKNSLLEKEVQMLKEKLWNATNKSANFLNPENNIYNNSTDINPDTVNESKNSKRVQNFSVQSKSFNSHNYSKSKTVNPLSTLLLQKLQETLNLVTTHSQCLHQIGVSINQVNSKITKQQEIWTDVLMVKQMNAKLKDELNQLKQIHLNPSHSDQLLQQQHPTLYYFFSKKMKEIQLFESRLQKLQQQSVHVINLIQKLMIEGLPIQKSPQTPLKQPQQTENQIRSKLKKQLQQKFLIQKQLLIKQNEKYITAKQEAFNQEITKLNKEIERLRQKNEDMYNLFKDLEQHQKQLIEESQEQKKEQSVMQPSNKKNTDKQIQMTIQKPSPKEQIDRQLITYLQQKTENLEKLFEQQKQKIKKYKKEIRYILDNYKVKSTKLKTVRCNQCMFSINDERNEVKRCEKCRLELHFGECYKDHEQNCKKRLTLKINQTTKNKNQKKRNSNQLSSSTVSDNMDYF